MTGQTIGLLLVMIIYLILMVGIGVLYSKKNNDVSDFYLGGRENREPIEPHGSADVLACAADGDIFSGAGG